MGDIDGCDISKALAAALIGEDIYRLALQLIASGWAHYREEYAFPEVIAFAKAVIERGTPEMIADVAALLQKTETMYITDALSEIIGEDVCDF